MDLSLIVLAIPMYFVLIAIEAIYDVVADKKRYRLNDAIANISCGIFEQVTGVFVKVIIVAMYALVFEFGAQWTLEPTWYNLVLMFIGVDFFYYWAHRHSHTVNLFWTGHVVHHQSEDYNLSVALRQGALQKIFTGAYYWPMALLGFPGEWFLTVGALQTLYQFWIHTEAVNKMGIFGYVFNTPSHHRVHHGRNPKYIDKNHGGTLIIWDRMFGTFQAEEERPTYGITTPINTFDPVAAHIHPWKNMWQDMKLISGFWNKVKYLFMKPGWLPKGDGGFRPPKDVDKSKYRKFDYDVPKGLNWYLFTQYFITLGLTSLFLFMSSTLPAEANYALTALIVLGVMSHGQLFNAASWAFYLEYARWILLATFAAWWTFGSPEFIVVTSIASVLALGSIIWVSRYHVSRQNQLV